jgi:signal transduction histidine kinase
MSIKKKITYNYVILSLFSTSLLCVLVFFLFRSNNQYYFLKRLEDRAKIVALINDQQDPEQLKYYQNLKNNVLEKLIEEEDFVLKVNSQNTFEYNLKLNLPNKFYTTVLKNGKDWYEIDSKYFLGQLYNQHNQKFIVIIAARDRKGYLTTVYILRILFLGVLGFILLSFLLGRYLAKKVTNPVARITKEVKRISASNLSRRLPALKRDDEISDLSSTFNDMLDRLETSFEIQTNFINNASHELKTPITTIIAESEITLLKKRKKAEYIRSLDTIHKQASKLGNLTESLLKLNQTGYDGTKQVLNLVQIDDLLLEVKGDIDIIYPDNKVSIKIESILKDSPLLLIPCNKSLLELAINNIISNGIKYSDNKEVFVNLNASKTNIKITFSDIGIGIPAEDLPHLYEPFFRGQTATKYNGYGLGLPLAMKIIRMHNGELQIQSEPGKGTIVTVIFKKNNIKNPNVES